MYTVKPGIEYLRGIVYLRGGQRGNSSPVRGLHTTMMTEAFGCSSDTRLSSCLDSRLIGIGCFTAGPWRKGAKGKGRAQKPWLTG
jgi:hypothetical protein